MTESGSTPNLETTLKIWTCYKHHSWQYWHWTSGGIQRVNYSHDNDAIRFTVLFYHHKTGTTPLYGDRGGYGTYNTIHVAHTKHFFKNF